MRRQKGFSLIELLIVVAIILIIAAIAIPNLLRSKIAANEASAVACLRTIVTAQMTYQTTNGQYAPDLPTLGPGAGNAGLLDAVLANGATNAKNGYLFSVVNSSSSTFQLGSSPFTPGSSGYRAFCADEQAVLYVDGNSTSYGTISTCLSNRVPQN